MDQLILKPRKAVVEEPMECWDDDLDIGGDDFNFRGASLTTTASSNMRDSVSSRQSFRSDVGSSTHGDDERQVHVPSDDERSTTDAIAQAKKAGIPIPENVPKSALMGGTIKRLGGRRIQRIIKDDWDEDFAELPGSGGLHLKTQDGSNFPDALRQVSVGSAKESPVKLLQAAPVLTHNTPHQLKPKAASSNLMLDRYRDQEDDDFFGDGGDTIKVTKSRQVPKILPLIPPTPQRIERSKNQDDDFEHDFQFPADGRPLRLSSSRKDIPKTPNNLQDDFDEWGEGGSLGTRNGGTKRDLRSNRSSSASALSPSVASSVTAESDADDVLNDLILPPGPIHFDDMLKRRQDDRSPDVQSVEKQAAKRAEAKEDFLAGLEIGDGDVFNSKKLTLNRNIKLKAPRPSSPSRPKTSVSITFTNKPNPSIANVSRLPRPLGGHERTASCLEPVSESGGPIIRTIRRSQSRLGGHSSQSSIASIGTPTTPSNSSLPPSTPRRRDLGPKTSFTGLRNEPTTTNAQLLKLKRSMPSMKTYPQSPAKPMLSRFERPSSRTDSGRPIQMSRARSPFERDRSGAESSLSHARKNTVPFLPAGVSNYQSHHVAIKSTSSRHFRRHDSESSNNSAELRPSSRAMSRSTMRSPSPRRNNPRGAEALVREAAAKHQVKKPVRRRHYGDGFELDGFDDLPTSRDTEKQFVKEPAGYSRGGQKLSLRHRSHQEFQTPRTTTPAPSTPLVAHSAQRSRDDLPSFARDTAASRMAREHSHAQIAQRTPSYSGAPFAALTNQWKAKVQATTGLSTIHAQSVKPKKIRGPPKKPQLIKPLGNNNNPKSVKGMYYNPYKFRWEGNETELQSFDPPSSSTPSTATFNEKEAGPALYREKENTTPRPALIQNVNPSKNVQVVGGMVFDPERMCWLKMPGDGRRKARGSDASSGFEGFDEEEEDVFKDVPDLEDTPKNEDPEAGGAALGRGSAARKARLSGGLKDDWLVGEEFDVGPEFIRRQREEEERWRRKTEKWVGPHRNFGGDAWRWLIRDVLNQGGEDGDRSQDQR